MQAALNLFPDDNLYWDTYDGYLAPHYVRTLLMTLPPAQPNIIHCKDCQLRDENGCCKHWKGLSMSVIPIATDDYDFCSSAKRREE